MSRKEAEAAALVAKIRRGDPTAEAELVALYSEGLTLMLRRLVRDWALAEDLRQETFRILLEKARAGEIQDPERLAGFLRGTARNLLLNESRRSSRRPPSDEELVSRASMGDAAASPDGPQLSRLLRREEARQLRQLLDEMRFERDRQILIQFYLSEKSKKEICTELGVDPAGFKKVLFRARERLRDLWKRSERARQLASTAGWRKAS